MIEKDEDYEYGKWRQRRLDEIDQELVIGSGLKDCDKVQRFANHDPAPHLPFSEEMPKYDLAWGALTLIALAAGFLVGFFARG